MSSFNPKIVIAKNTFFIIFIPTYADNDHAYVLYYICHPCDFRLSSPPRDAEEKAEA